MFVGLARSLPYSGALGQIRAYTGHTQTTTAEPKIPWEGLSSKYSPSPMLLEFSIRMGTVAYTIKGLQ